MFAKALKIYFSHWPNWLYLALLGAGLLSIQQLQAWHYAWLGLVLLALVPFIEYFTHKYFLHMPRPAEADKHPFWQFFAGRIHYLHHEDPKALPHIFAEWWVSLPALLLYSLLIWGLTRNPGMSLMFITCLIGYFLVYEWFHFTAHLDGYTPFTRYGRFMKKFHLWHHYKNEAYWFGVTCPLADKIFGSWKSPREIAPSALALKNRGRI